MGFLLSFQGVLSYKVGGQAAGGSYLVAGNVQDITLPIQLKESDVSVRAAGGYELMAPTLMSIPIDFNGVWDPTDAFFAAALSATFNRTVVAFKVLDSTGVGIVGDFCFFKFQRNEKLAEAMMYEATIKLTYSATPPSRLP